MDESEEKREEEQTDLEPAAPPDDPWDQLFGKLDGHEVRLAALEAAAHSSHTLDESAINHIAEVILQRINAMMRARLTRA